MRIDALSFKNENGDSVTIVVDVYVDSWEKKYRIGNIKVKPFRKRKDFYVFQKITDNYDYRALDNEGRQEYLKREALKYCTEEQLKKALLNAYEAIKPNLDNIVVG